jgi:hypothetical protein
LTLAATLLRHLLKFGRMKKVIIAFCLLIVCRTSNGQDTVYLKTGQIITGKFISIQCLNVKIKSSTKEMLIPLNKLEKVISDGKIININIPCPEVRPSVKTQKETPDSLSGVVLLECYMCAEKGRLEFISQDSIKTISNFSFLTNEAPYLYRHREKLPPGKYNWFYSDNYNMKTKGKLVVLANKEIKIVLFENKEEHE